MSHVFNALLVEVIAINVIEANVTIRAIRGSSQWPKRLCERSKLH